MKKLAIIVCFLFATVSFASTPTPAPTPTSTVSPTSTVDPNATPTATGTISKPVPDRAQAPRPVPSPPPHKMQQRIDYVQKTIDVEFDDIKRVLLENLPPPDQE